jgi:hypothetical protein
VIDIIFLVDLLVNFRTSYVTLDTGDEVIQSKRIAKNYLCGTFWVDMMASIPFERFSDSN